jgi:3-hydroxyisobutyrate dehydrogenase
MARRLLGAGFPLVVYNRSRERAEPFVKEGAQVAATPGQAAQQADVVISMVADDRASRAVWTGDGGALAAVRPGVLLIESSTISLPWLTELAAAARQRGCHLLDAPVTGSKPQAESGQLLFLVGGDTEALERARPVLTPMARGVMHLGPNGSGVLMKLINNFVCGVQTAALAEAVALIERTPLKREQALDMLYNGAPGSPMVKIIGARMQAQDYRPNFELQWMAKDLGYALEEAERRGLRLETAMSTLARFRAAAETGWAESDLAAVVEPLRSQAR